MLSIASITAQSARIKEKKGFKYLRIKKEMIGPFDFVEKNISTSQYLVLNEKWGVIDEYGDYIIPLRYDTVYSSNQNYFVKENNKYGVIDTNGVMLVDVKFQKIDHFDKDQSGVVKFEEKWMKYENEAVYEDENIIFKSPEVMPRFSDCEDYNRQYLTMTCDIREMLQFIYDNIKYPKEALEKGISGMVVIKFIVEKDGSLTNMDIVREIGGGCGQEALSTIKKMNRWVPGMQDSEVVRTAFYLPVRFSN
jgi:TonB family protein